MVVRALICTDPSCMQLIMLKNKSPIRFRGLLLLLLFLAVVVYDV